jgi:hypothetical protein
MEQAVVRVDGNLAEEVRTYCRITGVPITQVLDEAISRWLEAVAPARLSGLHEGIKERGPNAKLNFRELELLGRYEKTAEGHTYHLHNEEPVPAQFRVATIRATGNEAKMLTPNPVTGAGPGFAAQGGWPQVKPARKRSGLQTEVK